jgi:hypothetical protein
MIHMDYTREDLEDLKIKAKRKWRKAIVGDEEKRIRDCMSDPDVQKRVKLVDTASFTVGVALAFFAEYLLFVQPSAFPSFYYINLILLMLLRYYTYKSINSQFFMIDFCYFMQVSTTLQTLTCPVTSDYGMCSTWFKSNFLLSHGPLGLAIVAWANSIVFHSLDKMTSFYIHIMPPLTYYLLRWNIIPDSVPESGLSLSFTSALLVPLTFYLIWQVMHLYIQQTVIDNDPELVTSVRYLTSNKRSVIYGIIKGYCTRLGIRTKGEVHNPDSLKTKVIFFTSQFVIILCFLLPMPLMFYFRFLNTTYLLVLILVALWRGGSYYIFVFSRIYNDKFTAKDKVQ